MKRILFLFSFFIICAIGASAFGGHFSLLAQSSVDKLVQTLDSLSLVSVNNWKVSPDIKNLKLGGDPTQPGFDDSRWDNLRINASIYPDSCWIRKEITLPKSFLGQSISGPIKFLVSVDDYGYLWVNGESKGHFPWDGEFELTKDAKPGQKFLIAIKAINTGGPLRLLRAEFRMEKTPPLVKTLTDFSLSLQVGQKLLGFDTYQTNARKKEDPQIDKSSMDRSEKQKLQLLLQATAAKVNVEALGAGAVDTFNVSLDDARKQLTPIRKFAKKFTLYFDANAHIDAAWLWRDKETIEICKNTFASVFNMMAARPEFTYTQSAAAYYDWMERYYPDIFKGIQERVKEGRWEVVGGMWVEPDCNLPGGDSWARHLLYAKNYFRKKLGADVRIGWNPDSFGYNWNMPMFYANAGIDAFVTQKIGWNESNVFPYRVFWWQSPDSSRVLTYFPYDYVNEINDPFQLVDWMRQFEANTGFTKMMILFGVGDHGGGPSIEMLDRIKRLEGLDIFPSLEYGTMTTYLDWLKTQDLKKIPVWNDELYLEYHQGTYTTQANMKKHNRASETLLTNAEKFSALASMYGKTYHSAELEDAWHNVLFNQFHDILPGSGIRENYIDATEKYDHAEEIGTYELQTSLKQIAKEVSTSGIKKGIPVVVFNPLSWERSDLVTVQLPKGDKQEYALFDPHGREVPSQIVQKGTYDRELMFVAANVPSVGYITYTLQAGKPSKFKSSLISSVTNLVTNETSAASKPAQAPAASVLHDQNNTQTPGSSAGGSKEVSGPSKLSRTIENNLFSVVIDPASGSVASIVDKRSGREILGGHGNELQLLEDKPSAWDAWNIGLTGVQYPSTLRKIEVIENGPVRTVVRVTRDYLKPGTKKDFPTEDFPSTFFTQDVILYDNIARIDFKTDVDWWEEKTMLKVAFPLSVSDPMATYEIPFGSIKRSTQMRDSWEKAKVEVPAQRWADLSQDDYGVSLLNRSKYGYDIKGSTIRLSLLRSPKWPDPTADRGKHSIEYALYPHGGRIDPADVTRKGYEYNDPLIAVMTDMHEGKLPASQSFVKLEPKNLVLTAIKKAEDSDAWIIQWYNTRPEETEAALVLPRTPKKVMNSNFLEEDGKAVSFQKNRVNVATKRYSVVTLKVSF